MGPVQMAGGSAELTSAQEPLTGEACRAAITHERISCSVAMARLALAQSSVDRAHLLPSSTEVMPLRTPHSPWPLLYACFAVVKGNKRGKAAAPYADHGNVLNTVTMNIASVI